ncbi:MAG: NUDIX domain-containing protein [Pseudomonadota bacterium]|nr:NUDIX domain-containing protein [Pseudomonadota bacterium]
MRRFGETLKRGIRYRTRVGVYGIIMVGKDILLTEEDGNEILLPGGGVDQNEQMTHALVRECYEETGWKILPIRRLGAYQRFVFMPEYDLWAHKVCHIYLCRGIYPICLPIEKKHIALIAPLKTAKNLLGSNFGDISFVENFANSKSKNRKKLGSRPAIRG